MPEGGNVHELPQNKRFNLGAIRGLQSLVHRLGWGSFLSSFGGKRNYNRIFGWDDVISPEGIQYMYNRGGIARRVVDAYPDAVWGRPPIIYTSPLVPEPYQPPAPPTPTAAEPPQVPDGEEDVVAQPAESSVNDQPIPQPGPPAGDPAWDKQWDQLCRDLDIWTVLHRLDKLASLGQYAVLVIGSSNPNLETPLTSARQVNFLQPYGENSVQITEWDRDTTSKTFGRPIMYRVYPESNLLTGRGAASLPQSGPTRSSFRVHASRVVHVALNPLEDDIFGVPRMAPVWDYLTDLRKVVGSSSESYWINANRGLQADVDKEMSFTPEDAGALSEEIDEYLNGFRRFVRTKGVKMNALSNDLADPSGPFNVLLTLISGTSGIPKRVLLGSEMGQLASTQDKGNWAERIEECRALHVEPRILAPLVKKFMALGALKQPKSGMVLRILWPDAYRMSPLERGQTSAQTARSMANIVKMLESKNPTAQTMLSREECRALIGFSSDNRILARDPII